jgi:phage protein D
MNKLLNHRRSATYEGQSAGSIVNDLAGAAGLDTGEISEGPELPAFAVDRRRSAWAHVKSLADRLGYELYCDREGKLQFRAHGAAAQLDSAGGLGALAGAAASVLGAGAAREGYAFGKHLLRLEAARRTPELAAMIVGGESPSSTEGDATAHWLTRNDADYRGSAGNGAPESLRADGAARTKDLADRFAAGLLSRANRRAHEITLRILGRPSLELGQELEVSAVPDALGNGSGYVRALRHRFDSEAGFITEVRLALEGEA